MNDIPLFEGMPVVDERSAPRDSLPGDSLIESVIRIFSDITRYPTEIIEPHADLETDLGIDSVKFGEIFAVLRERYSLPAQDVMKNLPPERFRLPGWAEPLLLTDGHDHDHDVRGRDRPSLDRCASGCLPRPTTYASVPSSIPARYVIPCARVPPVCSRNRGARWPRADGGRL